MTGKPAPQPMDAETTQQLASLALRLSRDPKTRKDFLKAVKQIDPSRRFPDMEIDELREEIAAQRAEDETKRQVRATEEKLAKQKQGLLDGSLIPGRQFSAEDVEKMEKEVMPKHSLADYEAAAIIYGAQQKPASATPEITSRGRWQMPDHKGLMDNPLQWSRTEANNAVRDILAARAGR